MKLLLFIILFFSITFSQITVRTTPQIHDWETIYDGILGDNGDQDTTDAFVCLKWAGHVAVAVQLDSAGYGDDDSCKTLRLQYKRDDMDWGGYYNTASATVNYVELDTIARGVQDATVYIDLTKEISQRSTAKGFPAVDSLRMFIFGGVGDSIACKIEVGGQ